MAVDKKLAFATIRELGKRLRAGEFTSVELTEFFLRRLEKQGPPLNAVVTVTRELALGQAEAADRELKAGRDRGPLHGIPYGAKDLLATLGIPTTWGAEPYKNRVINDEATVVRRLREAGAVLAAKLAMVEIAGGMGYRQANAALTGPGLNPWAPDSWAGGSSSGSGAAVGAGLVPFAIGSETWGSIMTPAGYCGVTGLRPTYGRISRAGAMALSWTMDKIGPLARTADDCGLVLHAIAGLDPRDETTLDATYRYSPADNTGVRPARPFRLALLAEPRKLQPEVQANFDRSLEKLRELGEFREVKLPDLPSDLVAGTIISCEMAAAFGPMVRDGSTWDLTAPEDRIGGYAAQMIPAVDYINAFRIRRKLQRALDELLVDIDAIVTPTLATVAPPIARSFREYQAGFRPSGIGGPGNAAGIPAITVPNGLGERGLPTGLQFVGRAGEENRLIEVAAAYQRMTDYHNASPPALQENEP
ncbi:MAG: Glutamyl-tRNA(Gln) amidotransferase subunit [Planctomycetota bacterium]|jgi:aspartyl-tRNA(Asn)/glutamyl-tRNA(Gln) amidotransferase subunit A